MIFPANHLAGAKHKHLADTSISNLTATQVTTQEHKQQLQITTNLRKN